MKLKEAVDGRISISQIKITRRHTIISLSETRKLHPLLCGAHLIMLSWSPSQGKPHTEVRCGLILRLPFDFIERNHNSFFFFPLHLLRPLRVPFHWASSFRLTLNKLCLNGARKLLIADLLCRSRTKAWAAPGTLCAWNLPESTRAAGGQTGTT